MSLTSQKLQQLKQTLSKYPIDNPTYIYTIGNKQSSSSLFNNQRILYVDLRLKTIHYANIGKDEPFANGKVPEAKASINMASSTFKYMRVKQKQPTLKLWEDKGANQSTQKLQQWKFELYSLDVLLELINIINHIYNTARSSSKPNMQKSDVLEVQQPKGNSNLAVQQPDLKSQPVYTPSSRQNIGSKVQSPIHKLDDFDDNKQNFKHSDVSANKNNNKAEQRILESKRFDNDDDDDRFKGNSLPNSDKNRMKTFNFTDPEVTNKNQPKFIKQIGYPTSKQQESYYDPNAKGNIPQKSQKSHTIIPPLNMQKLHQTKSQKKYNHQQEDNSFSKLQTQHILNGLSKHENKPNSNMDNAEGASRSRSRPRHKNPLEIEISSIEFREDKEKPDDGDDDYNEFKEINEDDHEKMEQQQERKNDSIGSFGLNNTNYQYKSENYGSKNGRKAKDFNPQEALNRLKLNPHQARSQKNKKIGEQESQKWSNPKSEKKSEKSKKKMEITIESQFPDWNRMFFQSNYSIEVYQKFIYTCNTALKEKILPSRIVKMLNSKQPEQIVNLDGIKYTIYAHTWIQSELSLLQPTIYLKQHKNSPASSTLAHLYCRIHNEQEERRNIWESNRYVMQKLLSNKLQESIRKSPEILIDQICANLSCRLQYMGLLVYCQADFDRKCYAIQQNWQVIPQVRKNLSQLQQLINLELPNSIFCLYERRYKTSLTTPSYIIHITSPIQLICSAKDSLLTSYTNQITLQKNSTHKTIHNTLSAKGLSQFIHTQIQEQLVNCINTGYEAEKSGRMFSLCGASDYNHMMEYYNMGRDCIGSLHSIIDIEYYQQLIASQLCSDIFHTLLIYTFHQELPLLLSQQDFHGYLVSDMEEIYRQLLFLWINSLISYNSPSSEVLWRYLSDILNIVYGIKCENPIQDTLSGYVLDFVIDKLGIRMFYSNNSHSGSGVGNDRSRSRSKNRNKQPLLRNNYHFPPSLRSAYIQPNILNFIRPQKQQGYRQSEHKNQTIAVEMNVSHYRASRFSLLLKSLEKQVLYNLVNKRLINQYTAYAIAGTLLNFQERISAHRQVEMDVQNIVEQLTVNSNLPPYLQYLQPYLRLYLAQSIGLSDSKKYQHLRIYDPGYLPILSDSNICALVPHSSTQIQVYLQILKNLLYPPIPTTTKNNSIYDAMHLFNCVVEQNVFWGGEFNPYITQAYTLFSNYWVMQGDYAQAIKYYKSAMMIYVRIYPDSVFLADRHCYLAELLCVIGRYSEAVRELEHGIVKFQKYCVVKDSKQLDDKESNDQNQPKKNTGAVLQKQRENKLLMLKYIRATIKRSRILLKSTKNSLEPFSRYYNSYSSEQIGQIIDPLYSILNQLKQSNQLVLSESKKVPQPQMSQSASSAYRSSKPCLPFIQTNILKNEDLNPEVVQIFEIVVRCFALNGKFPQLTVFVGEYMLNTNIIQPLTMNMECFRKVLMMLLYYEIKISSVARKTQDSIIFTQLIQNLEQRGKIVRKAEAFSYIYNKYINIKNVKNPTIQPYTSAESPFIHQRERNKSPGGTSKKTERPMITLFLKRITESLKKIQKISYEIERYNLIDNHIPLNFGTKSEAEELIVLLQAIAALVGYDYLLALLQNEEQQYYENNQSSRRRPQKEIKEKNNIRIQEQIGIRNLDFAIRRY